MGGVRPVMKSRILVAVVGLGALLIGIAIGRSLRVHRPEPRINHAGDVQPHVTSLEKSAPMPPPQRAAVRSAEVSAKNLPRDLISQLKEALAHTGSRHAFVRLSNLIDSIDLNHAREVLNFAQTLKPQDRSS